MHFSKYNQLNISTALIGYASTDFSVGVGEALFGGAIDRAKSFLAIANRCSIFYL
ncbi:hypothetical protein F7734_25940 [Scytonema sp. UIC 10036]|uniref:hypothetical protein n=1 Tax=Scytonema sp. UIC 10036 TaxID=2304196 RepID=UPI0012DACACD|nr:hypothetical protein [Scytonema sp. UIC 10036]MUG95610.1 hypothetical protein [Scytonema sp. UIC 10036]